MITSRKSFDELKEALIAAMPAAIASAPIDFAAMKNDLIEERKRFDEISLKRAFTTDALMRSYTL